MVGGGGEKYLFLSANSCIFLRIINIYFNFSFLSNHLLFGICPPWHILPGDFGKNTRQMRAQLNFPFLMYPYYFCRACPWPTGSSASPCLVAFKGWAEETGEWGAETQGVPETKTIFIKCKMSLLTAYFLSCSFIHAHVSKPITRH